MVVPVENAGASDNIIYKDVPKSLNPNVTDSFQRAMWNLKLYGQSTQGADPSPTSPQEITAISQFDGNIRNSFQLFDASKLPTKSQGGAATVTNNGDGSFTISGSGNLTSNFSRSCTYTKEEALKLLKVGTLYGAAEMVTSPYYTFGIYNKSDGMSIIVVSNNINKTASATIVEDYISKINDGIYELRIYFYGINGRAITPTTLRPIVWRDGDGTWESFDSNPQELSYTPTNPMYSTQDGSISDYVDVEKGVEVYNMKPITFNNTQMSNVSYLGTTTSGYSKFVFNLAQNLINERKINSVVSCSILQGLKQGVGG